MTFVEIRQVEPRGPTLKLDVTGDAELTGGVGGWQELSRPRRQAATEWVGTPLLQLKVPLIVNGAERSVGVDVSIEPIMRRINGWGQRAEDEDSPPVLSLAGPLPVSKSKRWVLNDIELGTAMRNQAMQRTQQRLTLTFLEHREARVLRGPAARWKAGR